MACFTTTGERADYFTTFNTTTNTKTYYCNHPGDKAAHIALGEAMSNITGDGVLVIGSGFSFHNLKAFFSRDASLPDEKNEAFERWLIETCSSPDLDEAERTSRLLAWDRAPHARYCHPREEHLLPLHVCYGIAKRAAAAVVELSILNKRASLYLW